MAGSNFVRNMLVVFNALFLLLSLALVGIGISTFVVTDYSAILNYVPEHFTEDKQLIQDIGIAAITIGAISAIISFLGCVGAGKEHRKLLFSFVVLMIVVFLAVLISGIVAVTRQDYVRNVVQLSLELEANATDAADTGMLRFANDKYGCCGILDMDVCDKTYPPSVKCIKGSPLCRHGCLNAVWENAFAPYMQAVAITLFILAAIVLIGISFAASLFKSVNQGDYSYVRQD